MMKFKPKHYVEIAFIADWKSGEPKVLEPHKCESMEWFSLNKLPKDIMASSKLLLRSVKAKKNYFPHRN